MLKCQPISVTENGETTTFSYNPNGLRIGKKTTTEEIHYLIDEQSGFGDVVAEYVNGSKAKTYTLGDRRISQTVGNETHYYGTDQQGSVKFLTNTSGLTDDYTYDSFGVLKNQSGTTDNDFRYTGEQFDATLNMYNLRARYYAPEIGRFYGLDAYQGRMSDPESLHKYLYTSNDPINMIDPSGYFGLTDLMAGLNIQNIGRGTAQATFRVRLRKITDDLACIFIEEAAEAVITEVIGGIYVLQDGDRGYIGRTNDFETRYKKHAKDLTKNIEGTIARFYMDKNSLTGDMRIIEQFFIDLFEAENLSNKINSIAEKPKSDNSKALRKLLDKVDFCD